MNKKGIFAPTLVILTLIVFTHAVYVLIIQNPSGEAKELIGYYVVNLSNKFYEGDAALFAIKDSAKISIFNALKELGENGGFVEPPDVCRKIKGYVVWDVSCDPTITGGLEGNYTSFFNKSFNKYLINHGFENFYSYDLVADDSGFNVSVTARKNLVFKDDVIEYKLNTSFKREMDYNLLIYKEINDFVITKRGCFLDKEDPKECIDNKNLKAVKEGDVVLFDLESEGNYLIEENNELKFVKIKIKFAKDFTNIPSFT